MFIFSASRYDIQAIGNVKFRNGFVTRIERSYYDQRQLKEIIFDSGPRIEGILTFGPMELYYDVDLNLTYYQGSCSMLISFARVEFEFSVTFCLNLQTKSLSYMLVRCY